MKFFLDTAHIPDIHEATEAGLCDGVTTNPSLLSKEDGNPRESVAEIAKLVDGPVSAEVISTDADGMVREGLEWTKVASNIVVKVPMTMGGLKAIRILSSQDIQTNCTLIFNAIQALAAAKAGAAMVAPVGGRRDDIQAPGPGGGALPVPDGMFGSPMRASRGDSTGSVIELDWDVATCLASEYHILLVLWPVWPVS